MLLVILLGIGMVGVTVILHALGTLLWLRHLYRHFARGKAAMGFLNTLNALAASAVFLLLLHFTEAVLWASLYRGMSFLTGLHSFEDAVYFSLVTFTTLGYGDITLQGSCRVLAGIEAVDGILLFGWSSATLYAIVSHIYTHIGPEALNRGKTPEEKTPEE